jgi:hypothetical protein
MKSFLIKRQFFLGFVSALALVVIGWIALYSFGRATSGGHRILITQDIHVTNPDWQLDDRRSESRLVFTGILNKGTICEGWGQKGAVQYLNCKIEVTKDKVEVLRK